MKAAHLKECRAHLDEVVGVGMPAKHPRAYLHILSYAIAYGLDVEELRAALVKREQREMKKLISNIVRKSCNRVQ